MGAVCPHCCSLINESKCHPHNYPLPVKVSSQHRRVPREEDSIIDSPGKVLQVIHIIQIHSPVSLATHLVVLLRFAMPFSAVEQCKGQDLIGSDSLPIKIVSAHTPGNMEEFIQGV